MSQNDGDLQAALERVVAAARDHLLAVRAAAGAPDDEAVWEAYVELNNASHAYDELLNDVFGEVTPWDLEPISSSDVDDTFASIRMDDAEPGAEDPYPPVLSVRQRRDYRVPSVAALLRAAEAARGAAPDAERVTSVAEAVLELLQGGDGSLRMLDVPELDPLDGIVVVTEVDSALDPEAHDHADGESPFRLAASDRTTGRLDERAPSEPGV
jgi:hypothetical protein